MRNRYYLLLALLLPASSCQSKKSLDAGAYVQYVEDRDNGLLRSVAINGWEYTFQYKPNSYMALLEQRGNIANKGYQQRLNDLKGTVWFNLAFKKTGSSESPMRIGIASQQEYELRYQYYLNQAANDLALVYGQDTLRPISYAFETSYNLAPQEVIVVGFSLPEGVAEPAGTMQLVFFDRIFRNGIVKATFTQQSIDNLPHLKQL